MMPRHSFSSSGTMIAMRHGSCISVSLEVGRTAVAKLLHKTGQFLYYLNPNSLDRNLEYKTGSNLNPVKPNPADRHFKP